MKTLGKDEIFASTGKILSSEADNTDVSTEQLMTQLEQAGNDEKFLRTYFTFPTVTHEQFFRTSAGAPRAKSSGEMILVTRPVTFRKDLDHKYVIKIAKEELSRFQTYEIGAALKHGITMIKGGYLNEMSHSNIVIYLSPNEGKTDCCLRLHRKGDGGLAVHYEEIYPQLEFYHGIHLLMAEESK